MGEECSAETDVCSGGRFLGKSEWVGCGCLSHQNVIGGHYSALELQRTGMFGSLARRKEVNLTLTFLLNGSFSQLLDSLCVFLME